MKNSIKPPHARHPRAFSLVETSVALGLFSLLIMPVLGLITAGISHSSSALDRSSLHTVRDSLRLRLIQQSDWPANSTSPEWETTIAFSRNGNPIPPDEDSTAFVKVRLSASPATSHPGVMLEAIRCEFINPRNDATVTTSVIQRHRSP